MTEITKTIETYTLHPGSISLLQAVGWVEERNPTRGLPLGFVPDAVGEIFLNMLKV
ncbi:MAG: hypothetical protein F6J93_19825 [Oscillatoria sp. SIO1A7]|nr:hypothetical protein [Oscillatoria sp. SIO1A7]